MPSGTLYVVATPIGNLEDITLRALRVLRKVDLIAAEDTRRTARLLHHYAITTPTTSFHKHNEHAKAPELIDRLLAGQDIALVSDAGTPLVSDPGQGLVASARRHGVNVTPVPGASAVMAALSAAGVPSDQFSFLGFPPRRASARKRWLAEHVQSANHPVVVFEAPHRVRQLLQDALDVLGDRPIYVARELTKIHEEMGIYPISEAIQSLGEPRGEFVLMFLPEEEAAPAVQPKPTPAVIAKEVGEMTKHEGFTLRQAAAAVAKRYGMTTNEVYGVFARETKVGRTAK